MITSRHSCKSAAVAAAIISALGAHGAQLPSDVRPNHWASAAVRRALDARVMRAQPDGLFRGDGKITRVEAALGLARVGRALVDGTWKPAGKSKPAPDSVAAVWEKTNWKSEPVRRYAFAVVITRFSDYVANGLPRPAAGANVGKSEAIPAAAVKVSRTNPAYEALTYLAGHKMIRPDSPLLKGDDGPVTGGELSGALADIGAGVTDALTDLGKSADGSTNDDAFHKSQRR